MAVAVSADPTLGEAIDLLITDRLMDVHTCLPGVVDSYDKDTQTADIQIVVPYRVPLEDGSIETKRFAIIPRVPVEFSQSANFFMSFPVAKGDFVWLHFAEQSLDVWLTDGGENVDDPNERRFNLKDAWAVPARNPKQDISTVESDALVVGHKTSGPRAYFTNSIIGLGDKAPSEFVALAQKTLTEMQKLHTYIAAIHAVVNGATIPEPGGGFASALQAALKVAIASAGGLPSLTSPAATKVKAI